MVTRSPDLSEIGGALIKKKNAVTDGRVSQDQHDELDFEAEGVCTVRERVPCLPNHDDMVTLELIRCRSTDNNEGVLLCASWRAFLVDRSCRSMLMSRSRRSGGAFAHISIRESTCYL